MLLHKKKRCSFTRALWVEWESVIIPLLQGEEEEERRAMIQPVTNIISVNKMDLKALMLLCLWFHFVIVSDDVAAVRLSAITQEDWNFYF